MVLMGTPLYRQEGGVVDLGGTPLRGQEGVVDLGGLRLSEFTQISEFFFFSFRTQTLGRRSG